MANEEDNPDAGFQDNSQSQDGDEQPTEFQSNPMKQVQVGDTSKFDTPVPQIVEPAAHESRGGGGGGAGGETERSAFLSWGPHASLAILLSILMIIGAAKGSDATCLLIGVALFFVAFGEMFYSRFLANSIFLLSDEETTPANEPGHENDPDYCATPTYILWGHHWTSITGAAPIVGPAMAAYYGWLPGLLWVVLGCVFSGAVHDFSTLVVSARNGGRSIADLAGFIVSPRLRIIFLLLINFLCFLVVAKFMEVIARLFILWPETVLPIWMEIPLAMALGLVNRFALGALQASRSRFLMMVLSFVVLILLYLLVFLAVHVEDVHGEWEGGVLRDPVFGFFIKTYDGGEGDICRDSVNWNRDTNEYHCAFGAMQFWTILLCLYAMIASCLPVWLLLQPRDYINSHQLKVDTRPIHQTPQRPSQTSSIAFFFGGRAEKSDGRIEKPEAPPIEKQTRSQINRSKVVDHVLSTARKMTERTLDTLTRDALDHVCPFGVSGKFGRVKSSRPSWWL